MNEFKKIDNALKIYYDSFGRNDYANSEGIGKFLEYCIENGLEEEDINEEFNGDPSECAYIIFDEDFPLNDTESDDEEIQIFKIIKYCHENGIPPAIKKNTDSILNKLQLQLSKDEYTNYTMIYSKQCKQTWSAKQGDDGVSLWYSLCIGLKNNFPFAQYLTASYMRLSVENMLQNKPFNLNAWISNICKLFKTKTIEIPTRNGSKTISINELFETTIQLYTQRLTTDFDSIYFEQGKIIDNINKIVKYLTESSTFIKSISQNKYPFQFELVIALNEIDTNDDDSESDSSSDSDDSDEEKEEVNAKCNDCIGDIHKNLQASNCIFNCGNSFLETYKKFIEIMKEKKGDKYMNDYPKKRRIITFVDGRSKICEIETGTGAKGKDKIKISDNKNKDKITIFETASDYREYPDNNNNKMDDEKMEIELHVPEWGIEATRSVIIPQIGYPERLSPKLASNITKILRTKTAVTSCNGTLLVFSFHVEAENQVMCYMWWRSKCILFFPQYIDQFLPKIFKKKQDEVDFKFDGYDKCSWKNEQFERFYETLTSV
eukprot:213764_1